MRALIADDDRALRLITQKLLEGWGFEPVLASDGEEALQLMTADEDPPRLLLLDWVMPKIDGVELCRRLRKQDSSDPPYIILITSNNEADDIATALHAGANDFISKPTRAIELRARIGVGVRTLDLQRQLNIANRMLAYRAEHDELTGLRNRGSVIELLDREIIRTQRTGDHLAVAVCDIDFFKSINDNYGHPVGDRVLQEFAARMHESFRPYDILGRYGGEEFIIVSAMEESCVREAFERFRTAICEQPFLKDELQLNVSVSIGVRIYKGEKLSSKQLLLSLIADADSALYRAKHGGRNQTCITNQSLSLLVDPPPAAASGG